MYGNKVKFSAYYMIFLSYYTMWCVKFSSDHDKTQCWIFFVKLSPASCLLSIFHLTHILLLMMKMNANIFHMWKIRTEGRSLKSIATLFSKITTIVISKPCFYSVFREEHKAPLGTVNDKHHRGMPSGIGCFLYSFLAA